jgi:hypothetical protein
MEKKSFKSRLASLIFEEEPADKTAKKAVEQTNETTTKSEKGSAIDMRPIIVSSGDSVASAKGEVNDTYLNGLLDAIRKGDLSGNDYLEFRKSLVGMSQLGLPEDKLYQAVFSALNTQDGMTKKYLLESVTHYIQLVDEEKEVFSKDLSDAKENTSGSIVEEINTQKSNMEALGKKLLEIQNEIEKSKGIIFDKEKELLTANQKIEKAENDFGETVNALVNQINTDKEKITKYVPEDAPGSVGDDKKSRKNKG